jgi:hypothetical protein
MKDILKLLAAIALMSLKKEVEGLHVSFEGGDPNIGKDGHRFELGSIGIFNVSDEEVVALIVIGERIYAETNSHKKLVAFNDGRITQTFKMWAKGEI